MHDAPPISVIIPFFNARATLGRCIESLKLCDFTDLEIIAVDDCSTDGSAEIAVEHGVRVVSMLRRSGAAAARNLAGSLAGGEILFFVDADVYAPPGVVERVVDAFTQDPKLDALFGAYTIMPDADDFASVYKNLVHHFTHLTSRRRASTFWCGCGAVRRQVFQDVGGFDEDYTAASVEDIEFGYRLSASGACIRLDPSLRVVHAKRYTLTSLVRSDVLDRAIPWTKLMARENVFNLDLNLRASNVLSGILLALLVPLAVAALLVLPLSVAGMALAGLLGAYFALNFGIWWYVARVRGLAFSLLFLTMYSVTYVYSVLGFGLGLAKFLLEKHRESRP